MRFFPMAMLISLLGCTQFPELDAAVSAQGKAASYPTLVPIEPLLARAQNGGPTPEQTTQALQSRVTALRARANGLRRNVIDNATRTRMQRGVN